MKIDFLILYMLALHFVADFLLQSREMGKKKSSEFHWLFLHLCIQHGAFALGLVPFVGPLAALQFATANAVVHGLIDWNIWRGYKSHVEYRLCKAGPSSPEGDPAHPLWVKGEWRYWEDHWFYSTIGFDQLLHVSTLVILKGVLL